MAGRGIEDVRVVVSPYRICPLGAHIDHQVSFRFLSMICACRPLDDLVFSKILNFICCSSKKVCFHMTF